MNSLNRHLAGCEFVIRAGHGGIIWTCKNTVMSKGTDDFGTTKRIVG